MHSYFHTCGDTLCSVLPSRERPLFSIIVFVRNRTLLSSSARNIHYTQNSLLHALSFPRRHACRPSPSFSRTGDSTGRPALRSPVRSPPLSETSLPSRAQEPNCYPSSLQVRARYGRRPGAQEQASARRPRAGAASLVAGKKHCVVGLWARKKHPKHLFATRLSARQKHYADGEGRSGFGEGWRGRWRFCGYYYFCYSYE